MKHIITTDTHIGRKNDSLSEIKQTSGFFDWVIEISKEKEIESLIHLGDWNHNRRSIAIPTLNESTNIINRITEQFKDTYILIGNHDLFYKNAVHPHSLEVFKSIDVPNQHTLSIIESPTVIDNIVLIPWLINDTDYHNIVNNEYGVKYAMGHLAINNIIMDRSEVRSKNETLNISDFQNYELVLSGHYHQYGVYKNITYIAAPYHMDFNDYGNRGIYIFDSDTGDTEFIEYTGAPKYYVVDAEDYDDSVIEGNNIKLEFHNNLGLNEINRIIEDVSCLNPNSINVSYKFSNTFTKPEESDTMDEIKSNKEMLINYLQESDIPKNLRIDVFKNIISSLEQ